MRVLATDLKRLLYNTLLFSNKKSTAEGVICMVAADGWLTATATDDHVAFQDRIPSTEKHSGGFTRHISFDDAKSVEKSLSAEDAGFITDAALEVIDEVAVVDPDFWGMVFDYLSLSDLDTTMGVVPIFALNPNRMRKFSLVKTPGKTEYPIDFIYGDIYGRDVLAFKAGPTAHGILAPLIRETVAATLEDAEEAMW